MQVVRIYTGSDGEAHFEDVEIQLDQLKPTGRNSELWKANAVRFREAAGDLDMDFHVAPRRQLIVNLTGDVEYEVGSGEKRIFRPGSMVLIEDVTGRGHKSRNVGSAQRTLVAIHLD